MLLAETFAEEAARERGKEPPEIPASVASLLMKYPSPGNVRELRNRIFDAVSTVRGACLDESYFTGHFGAPAKSDSRPSGNDGPTRAMIARMQQLPALKTTEQMLIDEALRRAGGNQTLAARLLGMTRWALNKRLTRAKPEEQEG